jgi:hypothetical protein
VGLSIEYDSMNVNQSSKQFKRDCRWDITKSLVYALADDVNNLGRQSNVIKSSGRFAGRFDDFGLLIRNKAEACKTTGRQYYIICSDNLFVVLKKPIRQCSIPTYTSNNRHLSKMVPARQTIQFKACDGCWNHFSGGRWGKWAYAHHLKLNIVVID